MDIQQNVNDSSRPTVDLKNDLIPVLKSFSGSQSMIGSLTLLIVTLIIFFSAHIIAVKWQEILILIAVLLFHESGHLITMKLFKYNDVKMFFIPFIGAAVSGKSQKDTAVKSCIVSLMGPLPGIVLGVILYILFTLTKNYYIFKTAQVMLLLSAFNFLPVMPLDGGRYIDVLFINRRYFRLLFALLGAAIFILLAISAKDILLGLIGLLLVFGARANFKLHGVSNDLKAEGVYAGSVDELLENESLMQIVVTKLQTRYPRLFTPRVFHRAIYNNLTVIVDTLKFTPAKLFSKIGLLVFYLIALLASVVITIFFVAADFKEKARTEVVEGKKIVYVERHMFGRKMSECPVNAELFFDGKGTAFGTDGVSVSDVFFYSNGYRTGEWQSFDEKTGALTEKKIYDNGRLISISKMQDGAWKTIPYAELSFLRRFMEEIQRMSQPFRSNHEYF